MTNPLDLARQVLRDAGYTVVSSPDDGRSFHFEDEAILGSLHILDEVKTLLEVWESKQDAFLRKSAKALRSEPMKAWNVYTVVLSIQPCPRELQPTLEAVEEDFRGTRKIARADVRTIDDVEQALLPLLPLRSIAILRHDDPIKRLRARLLDSPPRVVEGLIGDEQPHTLASWLADSV